MYFSIFIVLAIALVVCISLNNPLARTIGGFIAGILALCSALICLLLLYFGFSAGWTGGDSAGMLIVMLGVVFFGILTMVFVIMVFSAMEKRHDE